MNVYPVFTCCVFCFRFSINILPGGGCLYFISSIFHPLLYLTHFILVAGFSSKSKKISWREVCWVAYLCKESWLLVEVDKEMTGSSSVDKKKENEWFELISLTLPCLLFSVPLCFGSLPLFTFSIGWVCCCISVVPLAMFVFVCLCFAASPLYTFSMVCLCSFCVLQPPFFHLFNSLGLLACLCCASCNVCVCVCVLAGIQLYLL